MSPPVETPEPMSTKCGVRGLGAEARQRVAHFDSNRDATRQQMRSFVWGQCRVDFARQGRREAGRAARGK